MTNQYRISTGKTSPLGASVDEKRTNFVLYAEHATAVSLALFSPSSTHPFLEIPLSPHTNKTGSIWHVAIEGLPKEVSYGYLVDGPNEPEKGLIFDKTKLLSDPYAKGLTSGIRWGDGFSKDEPYQPRSKVIQATDFDWEGVASPEIPLENLVIYEMHVRGFTRDKSSKSPHPGSFLAIIEKIPYLKSLGVNAVELLPIFEFNECENKLKNPINQKKLHNYWGYSTVNFFSPMNRYATENTWNASLKEFKTLVRELHRNNIEVILDVVYNHTAEGDKTGPFLSYKGLDNSAYYILSPNGEYLNFSGTGNTFNCNHPVVKKLIIDSLKYWVGECGIDGFRFDLASILTRGPDGEPLAKPPCIEEILDEPLLGKTKWIAEAWDAAGLYQVGSFPGFGKWCEWNGKFRDVSRKFIKGTDGLAGPFATVLCGSEDLYGHDRAPFHSINFITAHDGYTLRDLVTYQSKHNEANGEENRDGDNNNESWNCGIEGDTDNLKILKLRDQQIKNFYLTLFLSIGTPMMHMGDEYAHTRKGNNNPYCQDNELNWFLWDELDTQTDLFTFCQFLIKFRLSHKQLFCRKKFLTNEDVTWHGTKPEKPSWDPSSRLVAYTLHDNQGHDVYIAFNAHFEDIKLELPHLPDKKHWYRVIDTSVEKSEQIQKNPEKRTPEGFTYTIRAHSSIVLKIF